MMKVSLLLIIVVVLVVVVCAGVGIVGWQSLPSTTDAPEPDLGPPPDFQWNYSDDLHEGIISERKELDEKIWSDEVLAQEYEEVFVRLWDKMRNAPDKWEVLAAFPIGSLRVGEVDENISAELGIRKSQIGSLARTIDAEQWPVLLAEFREQDYQIEQSEWHHARFSIEKDTAHSVVNFTLHITNKRLLKRFILKGELAVHWQPREEDKPPIPQLIEANRVVVLEREGKGLFEKLQDVPFEKSGPFLAVYDLDKDGRSDIIHGSQIFYNRGNGQFDVEPLSPFPPFSNTYPSTGVVADFDGDGHLDFFCIINDYPPLLLVGDKRGRFPNEPLKVLTPALTKPKSVTAGDIDGDGDLDIWIAQYRDPYGSGTMPIPYYDANDGNPAFLLLNDGHGNFREATVGAGLSKKRYRRTYASSFVDLDADDDLDLVVISDFAGVDVYTNDGKGHFTDVTATWVDESHSFGMSHVFADFNLDGRLDFFMTGMGSTTARRLDHMNLGRSEFPEHQRMRTLMGYGNRMYLAQDSGFAHPSFKDQVARTGWSWGCTAFDFDNDGDKDIYVGNGHISGRSCKDYCTVFWRHDIYSKKSDEKRSMRGFIHKLHQKMFPENSWNGFEHNCLLLNTEGRQFTNIGFLMNVAFEYDTRNVVSDDIDGDGRLDLLVVQLDREGTYGKTFPWRLGIYRNTLVTKNHWIGVSLREVVPNRSPIGARVTVRTSTRTQVARIVTGDSYISQHAAVAHFGLGNETQVKEIEVRWPDGTISTITDPDIDQYHAVDNREKSDPG